MAAAQVVGIDWYNGLEGYPQPGCPVLAVCMDNGRLQLMRDEQDDLCVLIDSGMRATHIHWNSNGSVLAVAGVLSSGSGAHASMVQFYTCNGELQEAGCSCASQDVSGSAALHCTVLTAAMRCILGSLGSFAAATPWLWAAAEWPQSSCRCFACALWATLLQSGRPLLSRSAPSVPWLSAKQPSVDAAL